MTGTRDGVPGSQIRRLVRNGLALGAGGAIAQVSFTVLEILAARELGAASYGVFVTAYVWTVLGLYLTDFGTSLWGVQQGSRNHSRLPFLLGSGLGLNVINFAGLYACVLALASYFSSNHVLAFLLVIFPYAFVLAVQNELAAVYSSYQRMHVSAWFQGLAPVLVLAVFFVFAAGELSLTDVGLSYVIGGLIATGAWLIVTLRSVRPRFRIAGIRSALRHGYQYGLTGIMGHAYFKSDVVLLTALAGVREAGIYAAAFKLVELVFKVAVLASRVFAPALFKASHGSNENFRVLASMLVRALAFAGLSAGIAAFILADDLIRLLFGEEYLASAAVLRILGVVMAAKCVAVGLQLLLSSMDMHAQRVRNMGVVLALHVTANVILIPRFGASGAAWATFGSSLLLALLNAWSASGRQGLRLLRWLLAPACLAAAVVAGTAFLEIDALPRALIALAAFSVGLLSTGILRPRELRSLVEALASRR